MIFKIPFKICLIIFCIALISSPATAQKKKDLLLRLEQLESRIQKDSLKLIEQEQQIRKLNNQLVSQEVKYKKELQDQEIESKEIINELETKLRNHIEVYDLYSFGYHPLRNSRNTYISQLKESQKAVIEARKHDVIILQKKLRSKQTPVEEKDLLVQKFNELYQFRPAINMNQLTQNFSPKVEERIQGEIQNKTQEEFIPIIRENLWIQALEEQWSADALKFLRNY